MKEPKDSFIFYRSFFESLVGMDKNSQADCLMALADYALNGNEPNLTPEVRMFFTLVKPQVDANKKRFENGCKGGRPKNQKKTKTKPNNNQKETKQEPNNNVNDNDNVNDNNRGNTTNVENILNCRDNSNAVDIPPKEKIKEKVIDLKSVLKPIPKFGSDFV